jgi:alpha-1,6-mannosyltransferase
MKTLHLTNSWHRTSGGIATFYRALIEQANQRGHEIRLVVPGEKDEIEDCGEFGRIYYLQSPRALFNHGYRLIYPSQYLFARGQLQQILISERPDLIEICDKYTLNYLGALLRTRLLPDVDFRPMVVGLSCERMDDNFRSYIGTLPFDGTFCAAYMRWLYFPFFDYHIANSEYTAAELRSAAQGHLVPRGTWIRHMGVNLQRFSPARRSRALRQRLLQNFGAPEASVLLLYVGRLVPEKNLPLLFDLLAHLAHNGRSDFRLLVVGDGIERAKWDADAGQRAPGRALFFGHIKDQNILADFYANADLFVHPNPHEPFGIAPLEAMASGLPLIAPDSGGITSYANSGNAWTVAPTVEQFSAAVHDALSSEELRLPRLAQPCARRANTSGPVSRRRFLICIPRCRGPRGTPPKRCRRLLSHRALPAGCDRLFCGALRPASPVHLSCFRTCDRTAAQVQCSVLPQCATGKLADALNLDRDQVFSGFAGFAC